MTVRSRENWAFSAQVVTAVGILVIAILSFVNQSNREFRNEIRTELAAIRSEVRDINTRLARVVKLPHFCGRFTVWDSGSFLEAPFEVCR